MSDALRLIFEYRGGRYVPLAPRRVRMVISQAAGMHAEFLRHGRFVELRSAAGEALRSMRIGDAEPPMVEFPSGNPEKPFGRTEPPPGTVVSLLMEDDVRATEAALVEVVPSTEARAGEAQKRDLAVVRLPRREDQ